jgi:CBS domain-containing protein
MAQPIREVISRDVAALPSDASIMDAARTMRERDIGDVLVVEDERLTGIVTDRDIVVRAIADGLSSTATTLKHITTGDVTALTPDDSVEDAIRIMRERAVRRVPVVQDGRPVGIVSIGDLALERDADSALADISAAKPDE